MGRISNTEITSANIIVLREESAEAGDHEMVAICGRALEGDERAWARCVEVIEDARAMLDAEPPAFSWRLGDEDGDNGQRYHTAESATAAAREYLADGLFADSYLTLDEGEEITVDMIQTTIIIEHDDEGEVARIGALGGVAYDYTDEESGSDASAVYTGSRDEAIAAAARALGAERVEDGWEHSDNEGRYISDADAMASYGAAVIERGTGIGAAYAALLDAAADA